MKIRVTKKDIDKGRRDAGSTCGCPIWHAINRQLELKLDDSTDVTLAVPTLYLARLGKLKIKLPSVAVEMQQILQAAPNARVEPFEFEAELELI